MRFAFSCAFILSLLITVDGACAAEPSTITLAHIRLHGDLSEAPTIEDPIFGSAAENFQSKVDRILKAQRDASINGLFLHIDGLEIGWGKLNELRQAVARFRHAGKKAPARPRIAEAATTTPPLISSIARGGQANGMPS